MSNIIEVNGLTKKYKNFKLDKVNFCVEEGKITGLIGINGAGKTTIIKSIAELIQYDSGEITFFKNKNYDITQNEKIGYVLDSSHFYENLSIKEMKEIVAAAYTQWDEEAFVYYCNYFKLEPSKKIEALSKGMKMKYALALALSHNAELLIMDEPTGGLDPLVRDSIMKILQNFVSDGKRSVLFSTHITSDLEKIADNIIFLHQGHIEYDGKLIDFLERYRIVKGHENQIGLIQNQLISSEINNREFRGLIETKKSHHLSCDVEIQNASIEDIMLGIITSKTGGR